MVPPRVFLQRVNSRAIEIKENLENSQGSIVVSGSRETTFREKGLSLTEELFNRL